MSTRSQTTAVGVFTDRIQVDRALEALHNAGFSDDQIGFIQRDLRDAASERAATDATAVEATTEEKSDAAATGAVGGGILGGLLGAAAALVIPGIGPALAGGILVTTLGGVAIGAVAGGLIGALTNMGIPEEEAQYYQQELSAGRMLLTVNAGARYEEAMTLLRSQGAYDVYTQPGRQEPITNTYERRPEEEARYAPPTRPGYDMTYPDNTIEQPAQAVGAGQESYNMPPTYTRENGGFRQDMPQNYRENQYRRSEDPTGEPVASQEGVRANNQPYADDVNQRVFNNANGTPQQPGQQYAPTYSSEAPQPNQAGATADAPEYTNPSSQTTYREGEQRQTPNFQEPNRTFQSSEMRQEGYRTDAAPGTGTNNASQTYNESGMAHRESDPYQKQQRVKDVDTQSMRENQAGTNQQPQRNLRPDERDTDNTPPPPNYRQ
ncbi:general stress protein [Ktedonospora formicarum]|uniref:General stress protein 17M-like domain-containing protein n=1 Tax=Ktedonospora formicarum TaxID=2778364 RepID=A0A8J3MW72_9CHLR|nr:general stress protein [Ktedonospora formicarum]GHO50050.1 hypothetical protein KSX_82130 [Ktedonospora formicarum]